MVLNDNKNKDMWAKVGISDGSFVDWCQFKYRINDESMLEVTETKDGNLRDADRSDDMYRINDEDTQNCMWDERMTGAKTQEEDGVMYVRPGIRYSRKFVTEDDQGNDLNLQVASNYTLLYQIEFSGNNYKGQSPIYLDDPANPILSGATKIMLAAGSLTMAAGSLYASLI